MTDVRKRPFKASSPWNTPIGTNVRLDNNAQAMASKLVSQTPVASLYAYGTPIFDADENTPRYSINCTQSWGVSRLELQPVPIPDNAHPAPGSDGQMVVIDRSVKPARSYEFWQYKDDHANTAWGDWVSIRGDGTGSTAVGAGTSRLAGVVRAHEIANGKINHALCFSTSFSMVGEYRHPATKTDGKYQGVGACPQGARIQLDPSVDLTMISGITQGEIIVGKALQRYGAYNIDCGGASMAFQFENPMGEADPYPAVGFKWDYFGLTHIPWDKIWVLEAWDSYDPVKK